MNKSLIILGPTAVGKTQLAIELAKQLSGEIISADSMQVYRGMDIGTAKPAHHERWNIPHYLMDIIDPDVPWTVSDFVKLTEKLVQEIKQRNKLPIIVGGTGLYLWTLMEGYSFPIAPADNELRRKLENNPVSSLYTRLARLDPKAAQKIHANDKKRIIRALEVHQLTGEPISELQERRDRTAEHRTQEYLLIGLNMPRQQLYQRIEQRVDQMIEQGLIKEVEGLLAKGYEKDLPSFQALGYKEAINFLSGEWDQGTMVKELKKRTRNFARRQLTWFRRFPDVKWFEAPVDTKDVLDYINSI